MDSTKLFDSMLLDLRQQFSRRIPGGLTDTADQRLNRTLEHYVSEVGKVQGSVSNTNKRDVLRLTYDSMAKWFRRNMAQLIRAEAETETDARISEKYESEVDPATLFASFKAGRAAPVTESTPAPAPAPFRMPDLEEVPKRAPQVPSQYGIQQKDVLQPQEDVVKYREVEYNLIMNSKDRDWLRNTSQNRYNFVIQFNTNFKPQGFGMQATIVNRLRNITRIEFVKAILPVEGLDVVVTRDCSGSSGTNVFNSFYSALALPSINVLVEEFQGNNFGTNNGIDNSLAICQYDATWRSDFNSHPDKPNFNRGYTLFFPKFMKAQRVYAPTPLANLQSLSFRIQDPENNLLSNLPDASTLAAIQFGNTFSDISSCYDISGDYIFLKTKEWFPLWSYSQLDKILIDGLTFQSVNSTAGGVALNAWLQDSAGHTIVGVAYTADSGTVTDGFNTVGYANWIIIRNRFQDPTTGGTELDPFSGPGGDTALATDLMGYPQTGGILNLSRQVQLVIRIITREYDLVSNIRPDNV